MLTSVSICRGNQAVISKSNSSLIGWGGVNETDDVKTGGSWSSSEKMSHINVLELLACFLTLKSLCRYKYNVHIRIFMDNTVAVSYINKMGGRKGFLNQMARDIWFWCIERHIWLSACHLPGKNNVVADHLSRNFNDDAEWMLNKAIFNKILAKFGQLDVDMFASRLNHQIHKYVSYRPDPHAWAIDAFSMTWSNLILYMFPPFSLVGRVLQKIVEDRAEVVLVAPLWTTQPWFPCHLRQIVHQSYILPQNRFLLTLLQDPL